MRFDEIFNKNVQCEKKKVNESRGGSPRESLYVSGKSVTYRITFEEWEVPLELDDMFRKFHDEVWEDLRDDKNNPELKKLTKEIYDFERDTTKEIRHECEDKLRQISETYAELVKAVLLQCQLKGSDLAKRRIEELRHKLEVIKNESSNNS